METHDPGRDIWPLATIPDGLAPADLAVEAAGLAALRRDAARRYRAGLGRFLAGIAVKCLETAR